MKHHIKGVLIFLHSKLIGKRLLNEETNINFFLEEVKRKRFIISRFFIGFPIGWFQENPIYNINRFVLQECGRFPQRTPNGQGTETLPNGQLVGVYKDGKPWNVKGYDKERNILGKWVNGVKQK